MKPIVPRHRRAALFAAAVLLCLAGPADAQGSLKAHYTISMNAVTVGHVEWLVDIGDRFYRTAASGKASGLLSFLVNGEGGVIARGTVENGKLVPVDFVSRIADEDGTTELRMTYPDGFAREEIAQGVETLETRIPVTDAHRHGAVDPLSAVLIPTPDGTATLSPATCDRVLAIFDGRRRYNLALSYIRNERMRASRGYSGPVLVCNVILEPIAGYRPDSMLVKFVSGRRDMELWFAPIDGTDVVAPIRVLIPTIVGALRIDANSFEPVALAMPAAPGAAPVR